MSETPCIMYLEFITTRGGGGESCARTPLFPRGFLLLGYRQPPPGGCYLSRASVRACERACAHFFAPPAPPPTGTPAGRGGGGGGGRPPPTTQQPAGRLANNKKKKEEEEEEEEGHHHTTTTTTTWLPLLALSFFLLGFEATSFAAFVTKNTKPDSVACCFKM